MKMEWLVKITGAESTFREETARLGLHSALVAAFEDTFAVRFLKRHRHHRRSLMLTKYSISK
jgi:hypothetical protein